MNSKYFKSIPNFSSTALNVDRENGILKNTCVANFGDNKNDSYFDEVFIQQLLKAGNEAEGGIKSRFGHPNMCATSFGTYIGRYRNFTIQNGNLFADLFLDPVTKTLEVEGKGMKMFDYIMTMAENNSDMFGNSIHIFSDVYEKPIDGEIKYLHNLKKFKAIDLVDDPAATDSLFSSNANDFGVIMTNFLDDNPQIFDVVTKQPNIIEDFFSRYENYAKRKSINTFNMNILEKLSKKFSNNGGSKFNVDLTLADGSIVTVITEAEQPQVGDEVQDDAGAPVADGTHVDSEGGSITTVGGKITEIADPAPAADPPAEPSMQEVMQAVTNVGKQFSDIKKLFEVTQKTNESAMELISDQLQEFQTKTDLKFSTFKSDYKAPSGEQGQGGGQEFDSKVYDPEKAKEAREAKKQK